MTHKTTKSSQDNIIENMMTTNKIKQYAHLYDVNNNPKILPEKYALSKAELTGFDLYYNHTPDSCVCIVEEARLPMSP
jgi:hypothetical protein